MEINTMPAGRAMDVLVADKVMGRLVVKASSVLSLGFAEARGEIPSITPPRCVVMGIKEDDDVIWTGEPVPAYSTDIAAAWKAFEKVFQGEGDSGFAVALESTWIVYEIHGHDLDYVMDGDTAPLAICRAALKWIQRPAQ